MSNTISKADSTVLKGIAVIMIILVHLNFSRTEDFIYVGGLSLIQVLSKISAPVEIFTFLGGVGLCITHRRGYDRHRVTRIMKLYLHMWIIMAIFVPMAYIMHDANCYPSGVVNFLDNVSGLYSTWNGTYWFVLPYAILSLSSRWLFHKLNGLKAKWILAGSFLLYFLAYFMRWRYANAEVYILHNGLLSLPVNVLLLQFPFLMGYITVRNDIVTKISKALNKGWVCWTIFLLLIFSKIFLVRTGFFFVQVYAALFCIFFVLLNRSAWIDKVFSLLGRHSLNIWFLHGWFVMSIFASITYRLQYSIIILLAVLVVSTFGSMLVNKICNPIHRIVESKFQ